MDISQFETTNKNVDKRTIKKTGYFNDLETLQFEINELLKKGFSNKKTGELVGVSEATVSRIKNEHKNKRKIRKINFKPVSRVIILDQLWPIAKYTPPIEEYAQYAR